MSPTVVPSPTSSLHKSNGAIKSRESHAIAKKKKKRKDDSSFSSTKKWTTTSSNSVSATEPKKSQHSIQTAAATTATLKNPLGKSSSEEKKLNLSPPTTAVTDSHCALAVATRTSIASVHKKKKKKNKKHSPFRIKAGCIVALRYRSEGNSIRPVSPIGHNQKLSSAEQREYVEVWADPQPGRDEGLALVGKRIRCCFPKSVLLQEKEQQESKKYSNEEEGTTPTKKSTAISRILEGEIISLIDYPSEWERRKATKRQRTQQQSQRVELLVDEGALKTMPFLQRIDGENNDTASLSEKEKKSKKFEEIIRGKHKVSVEVNIADISGVFVESATNDDANGNHKNDLIARWVIRKRIPIPLCTTCKNELSNSNENDIEKSIEKTTTTAQPRITNNAVSEDARKNTKSDTVATATTTNEKGMKESVSVATTGSESSKKRLLSASTTDQKKTAKKRKTIKKDIVATVMRYVGDGNDSSAQQERNWRWLASRYHDLFPRGMSHMGGEQNNDNNFLATLSAGFVGEVLKVAASTTPTTNQGRSLATVTLRRLILPEQTAGGRMPHHGPYEVFEDYDSLVLDRIYTNGKHENSEIKEDADKNSKAAPTSGGNNFWTVQVAVEELVILSRSFDRISASDSDGVNETATHPIIGKAYSAGKDIFLPLRCEGKDDTETPKMHGKPTDCCHRCRNTRLVSKLKSCSSDTCIQCQAESYSKKFWCKDCRQLLKSIRTAGINSLRPRCDGCDCYICTNPSKSKIQTSIASSMRRGQKAAMSEETQNDNNLLLLAKKVVSKSSKVHFHLPDKFINTLTLAEPSPKPITSQKKRQYRKKNTTGAGDPNKAKSAKKTKGPEKKKRKKMIQNTNKSPKQSPKVGAIPDGPPIDDEEYQVFKPTCSRTYAYDREKKQFNGAPQQLITSADSEIQKRATQRRDAIRGSGRHNVRLQTKLSIKTEKKASSGRAARANQRRLMKDVAAIGATSLGLDALAGREQQLRFDKSLIHAWGVFADEPISAGDMIVEYRGELIGNAVTEKREKIYEKAKIGSDYMFRIDGETVCDATKQGNVARFINASCEPNCYTQIVTINGAKRIVIYAKKDIQAGQELCYDYKFPFEYDESKRIKCYCGAKGCRGFMNWDKKYVVEKSPEKKGVPAISKVLLSGKNATPTIPDTAG